MVQIRPRELLLEPENHQLRRACVSECFRFKRTHSLENFVEENTESEEEDVQIFRVDEIQLRGL